MGDIQGGLALRMASFTILLLILSTSSFQIVFTFGEIGFDVNISGKGSVYRETKYISGVNNTNVLISWLIYYKLQVEPNHSISINAGLNNYSVVIKLDENPAYGEIKAVLKEINIIWINITVENTNLVIYPNSTIKILSLSNFSNYSIFYTVVFYLTFSLPIAALILKRLKLREKTEKIFYEE